MAKRILVTGSRTWTDLPRIMDTLWDGLKYVNGWPVTLVHGGAEGADALAHEVWVYNQFPVEVHPVTTKDWAEHGKRAAYLRNKAMVDAGADLCVAFIKDNSRGASMTAKMAEAAGIPTWRVVADGR